jgi:hypothetical protein
MRLAVIEKLYNIRIPWRNVLAYRAKKERREVLASDSSGESIIWSPNVMIQFITPADPYHGSQMPCMDTISI